MSAVLKVKQHLIFAVFLFLFLAAATENARALDVDDANCVIMLNHFELGDGWWTGLVVQNLSGSSQEVTIRSYEDDVLGGVEGTLVGKSTEEFTDQFGPLEKKKWSLAAQPAFRLDGFSVGLTTGWLLVLSEEPVSAFLLYGTGSILASLGPVQSEQGGTCL